MSFHRTNINLFEPDVAYLQRKYGYGWTEKVRDIVNDRVKQLREQDESWANAAINIEPSVHLKKVPTND